MILSSACRQWRADTHPTIWDEPWSSKLHHVLGHDRAGRNQIILSGVYAHVGVLATAVEAFSNDIKPFFVADATADFSEDLHRSTLTYAAQRCAYVTTVAEVL